MLSIFTLEQVTSSSIEEILRNKWNSIEYFLIENLRYNEKLSETIALNIIHEIIENHEKDEIYYNLMNIEKFDNNFILTIIENNLRGIYFKNIQNDANDPFVVIIDKNESSSFILADFSSNCSIKDNYSDNTFVRYFYDEYPLHYDKDLAKVAFNKLLDLELGTNLNSLIFFQFPPPKSSSYPLEEYTLYGIKDVFFKNNGDILKTFGSLEFLSPYYIYRDFDIVGNFRIVNRKITDARIIGIVSAFNLYDVIINDKDFYNNLSKYDESILLIIRNAQNSQRSLFIYCILLMIISLLGSITLFFVGIITRKKDEF